MTADRAETDQVIARLIHDHPRGRVVALAADGIPRPVPADIPVPPEMRDTDPNGLAPFNLDDVPILINVFAEVQKHGSAAARLRLNGGGFGTVFMIDCRDAYGCVVSLLEPDPDGELPYHSSGATNPARLTRVIKNEFSEILEVDDTFPALLGWSRDELVGQRTLEMIHPQDRHLAIENWMAMQSGLGGYGRVRLRHRTADGGWRWFEVTNDIRDDGRVVAEMIDISAEMAAVEALRQREQLLHRLTETLPLGVAQLDAEGRLVHANARLSEILDTGTELDCGMNLRAAFGGLDATGISDFDRAVDGVLLGADQEVELALFPLTVQRRRVHLSLRALTDCAGSVTGAVACVTDVTAASDLRHTLAKQAATDSLTGTLNRPAILLEVERWLGPELRHHGLAVAFCDLDQFKAANDHFGHAAGDELLQVAARRLRGSLRPGAFCGRLGGDEFLAVIPGITTATAAEAVARRIGEAMKGDVTLAATTVSLRASIGIAWRPDGSLSADDLIGAADSAMYDSKRLGTGEPSIAGPAVPVRESLHR